MVGEDGSYGAWHDGTVCHCSTCIVSLFRESAEQKVGKPGVTKVRGFHCYTNILSSQ